LHPHHKLAYFQHAGWAPVWVTAAKEIAHDEFDRSYRFRDEVSLPTLPESMGESVFTTNIFDNLPVFYTTHKFSVDELTRYLSTGPEDVKNDNLLKWWFEHQHVYPNLS
jgi:hypothetical protein